jgi:hypothetical protein
MKTMAQLESEIETTTEEIGHIKAALDHKEYKEEYSFEFKPTLTHKDFTHPGLKELVEGCNNGNVHLHPDLVLQLIEGELFERMKGFVKTHITGKAPAYLMNMKNDLERKMLHDQLESRTKKLSAALEEVKSFEAMVDSYEAPKGVVTGESFEGSVPDPKVAKKKKK